MSDDQRPKFGSVTVTTADVIEDGARLSLNLAAGALNKHELGMLIEFLRAKQKELNPAPK